MNSLYKEAVDSFNENYILYIPLTIILQSCIASIAAMYILINLGVGPISYFEITLCVILAMGYNGLIYAQIKSNIVFPVLLASLIINILLIAINVYQLS
ncbi:hypothetical protein BZARG_2480 [Bizionia argentinensis JUB59]|uniref:Uncharacterized protein n=1 Tax=Bizionia argentinensis JUB59 TaxID=1046627 RepID=G2ECI4_9FLAO|nr:hypothetical protein [Bizionia argentinensis]EGV43854.1 hypothetical protein BZARG_2480 [Bizionia argentinensis JUB59]